MSRILQIDDALYKTQEEMHAILEVHSQRLNEVTSLSPDILQQVKRDMHNMKHFCKRLKRDLHYEVSAQQPHIHNYKHTHTHALISPLCQKFGQNVLITLSILPNYATH